MYTVHILGSKKMGGAENFYLRLVRALHERGERVSGILRKDSDVVKAAGADIEVFESPMQTVWDPWSKKDVARLLQRLKPDLVQTYMGRATRLTALPSGHRPVHLARLGGYYKLEGYRHAHAWVGNTTGICDYLVHGGMRADRVFHISNFVDPPRLHDPQEVRARRAALDIPDDALVVVALGRFVWFKGHEHLLNALSHLPAGFKGRPLRLVLVGDGPLRKPLYRQAQRLGLLDRICWAGWQKDTSVFYQMADVVVFPSLDEEPLGNVILETWAHGKPLLTTLSRGARELTEHQLNAWCVPCADPVGLARGLRTLLMEPELAAGLAANGARLVARSYARDVIVGQYMELYHRLLESPA